MCQRRVYALFVLLAAATFSLRAQPNVPSIVSGLGHDKDYLFPTGALPMGPTAPSAPSPIDRGEVVTYRSFQGQVYTLTEFRGKNVSLLLPQSWLTGLSVEERRTLLDRSDLIYEHLKDVVAGEPAGTGLLRMALVPETCGWGCAWVGAKGLEVMDADWSLGIVKSTLAGGYIPGVFSHEMTHNFDIYWPFLLYHPLDAHAWTAFLDAYIQIYMQQGYQDYLDPRGVVDFSPSDWQFYKIWERWDFYARDPDATWQKSVRDADPRLGTANLVWGGLHLRFAQLHGGNAIRRAMQFLKNYSLSNPPPGNAEDKEDLDIEALAAGAGLNLSCYADTWRWHASAALRARMRSAYGDRNLFCVDHDRDGFSRAAGDLDDSDPNIHPVDEPPGGDFPGNINWTSALRVSLPGLIAGVAPLRDVDSFEFFLPSATRVRYCVRFFNPLGGWFNVHNGPRNAHIFERAIPAGAGVAVEIHYSDEPIAWAFSVWNPASPPGRYLIGVFAAAPWPARWGSVLPALPINSGFRLQLSAQPPPGNPPAEVRFWVSSVGFVGRVPYTPAAAYDWRPEFNLPSGTYAYRSQLFTNDVPVSSDTAASYFTITSPDTTPPVIIPQISGALGNNGWYRSNVNVNWSVTDPESGIASSSGCGQTVLSTETSGVTLTCRATNGAGLSSSASVALKIDKTPPIITGMPPAGCSLWPPNHKFVQVADVRASDALSGPDPDSLKVTGTSNEPSDPNDPDIVIAPDGSGGFTVQLRSGRDGKGTGRVYTLTATAMDLAGNPASAIATCTVPHDQGKK